MLLDEACDYFGWPASTDLLDPEGVGAAVCAASVSRRIGEPLKRLFPGETVETGILTSASHSAATAAPMAIVCQFRNGASTAALQEVHRLAWNFCGSALLITLEPHRLMAWSCYQDPELPEDSRLVCKLEDDTEESPTSDELANQLQIRELLHWVSLITGEFIRRRPQYFPQEGRADRLLLKNLRHVRKGLIADHLPQDICHDLLARVIFTQFLFHRKDSAGNPFFSSSLMARLATNGTLREVHSDLSSILKDKEETYALFRWMDERFNGDLFPGKSDNEQEREDAWRSEKDAVTTSHLMQLSELVSGDIDAQDRQLRLWPQYSFDTIPLEFISSVYEEFLTEDRDTTKAYYTPSHLVDYVLGAVLPWDGEEWNLRILDPASGSGIFLVKVFQRLIHRWRTVHNRDPLVSDLKPLLADNFYGVDINPNAVRVACFSLYLAMADAIDPKHYVSREKVFPRLRGTRLITTDFFDELTEGISSQHDAGTFNLVIGNAPWGDGSATKTSDVDPADAQKNSHKKDYQPKSKSETWARTNGWPIANHDIGPLFVAKGLVLLHPQGRIAMLQPAPPWLFQRAGNAMELRRHFFSNFTVDEITNLSAVRRELFHDAIGPACVIVAGHGKPSQDAEVYYFTPKPLRMPSGSMELRIEPQDVSKVSQSEAATDPLIWTILALGGRRDVNLIRRMSHLPTLSKLKAEGKVQTRMGVIPGNEEKHLPELNDKPYFAAKQFPANVFLTLDAANVSDWGDARVHSKDSTDFEAFKNPQLLIKQSYSTKANRFRAVLVKSANPEWGVICKETYLSVRDCSPDGRHLAPICLTYNSQFATYFLFMTSSRLGHYITEVPTNELLQVPLPESVSNVSSVISFEQIDQLTRESLDLTPADWILIEDMLTFSLEDAIRKKPGPGRAKTARRVDASSNEPELAAYGQTLTRVLLSTFGSDKSITFTVYQEPNDDLLPVRMLTLHLDWIDRSPVTIEQIAVDGLLDQIGTFHRNILSETVRCATHDGLGFQRVAFLIHSRDIGPTRVRNVTIIKPDERRYWTRSQAMRDADELASSIMRAGTKGAKR